MFLEEGGVGVGASAKGNVEEEAGGGHYGAGIRCRW